MPKNVQMPNGDVIQFPDNMSDQEVSTAIQTTYRPSVPKPHQTDMQSLPAPSLKDRASAALSTAGDTLQGVGKGAMNTLAPVLGGISYGVQRGAKALGVPPNLLGSVPDSASQATGSVRQEAQPTNTAEKIGYGAEQAGEFLAPMGAEKAVAAKLGQYAPRALPLIRTGVQALSAGAMNKAQGGSFGTGAAMGAGGGLLSEGLRAAAPLVAESAIGVRSPDRAFGRNGGTVGKAILSETKGVNPESISRQAGEKVQGYNSQLESMANGAGNVNLFPARQVAKQSEAIAAQRNNPDVMKRTGQLADQLLYEGGKAPAPQAPAPKVVPGFSQSAGSAVPAAPNNMIPPQVPAYRALQMKRGVGDLQGSWNPATPNKFADASVGRVYHALDSELDQAIPGSQDLNAKMSALMPVEARAGATGQNAGVMQRVLGRFTRPTGAMIGGAAGAGYGYKEGGLPGAAAGFATGMVLPELVGSPTSQMMLARGANSALVPPTIRALTGTGLQASSLYKNKEAQKK